MQLHLTWAKRVMGLACATLCLLSTVASAATCEGPLNSAAAAQCAVANHPDLRAARLQLHALSLQRKSAAHILPSHPVASFSLAERRPFSSSGSPDPGSVLNWYFTLSQEIEIAGQRGRRLAVVDAEVAAQLRRVAGLEQEIAATTLRAFSEALALREEVALATRAADVAAALGRYTAARAAQDLVPSIEADLAQAEAARWHLLRSEAEQGQRSAELILQLWLVPTDAANPSPGAWPAIAMSGSLEDILPWDGTALPTDLTPRIAHALQTRADVEVARAEVSAKRAQADLLQRSRIPSITASFTAQNDGFGERVLGGGLSMPLPLPEPLAPSGSGSIAAARVAVEQAKTDVEKRERTITQEVQLAMAAVQAAQRALSQVPNELIARAQTDLWAIAEAIRGGRVSLREALLWQRGLLDLLQLHLRARREYALARIELQRASGLPLVPVQTAPTPDPHKPRANHP